MNKKLVILILLAIFCVGITISSVSANDNSSNVVAKDNNDNNIKIEEIETDNDVLGACDNTNGDDSSLSTQINNNDNKIASKNSDYKVSKTSKTVTKKKTSKKKIIYKTFKAKGYKWKIKTSTWKKMKKQAIKWRNHFKKVGSITPGYSNALNVKVTKNGYVYKGIAMAIKNVHNKMRCEVRGIPVVGYIRCWM